MMFLLLFFCYWQSVAGLFCCSFFFSSLILKKFSTLWYQYVTANCMKIAEWGYLLPLDSLLFLSVLWCMTCEKQRFQELAALCFLELSFDEKHFIKVFISNIWMHHCEQLVKVLCDWVIANHLVCELIKVNVSEMMSTVIGACWALKHNRQCPTAVWRSKQTWYLP